MASHTVANEEIITPRSLTARPWYHISGAMLNFKSLFKDCVVEQGYTLNDLTLHWIFKYLLRRYRIYTPITHCTKRHISYIPIPIIHLLGRCLDVKGVHIQLMDIPMLKSLSAQTGALWAFLTTGDQRCTRVVWRIRGCILIWAIYVSVIRWFKLWVCWSLSWRPLTSSYIMFARVASPDQKGDKTCQLGDKMTYTTRCSFAILKSHLNMINCWQGFTDLWLRCDSAYQQPRMTNISYRRFNEQEVFAWAYFGGSWSTPIVRWGSNKGNSWPFPITLPKTNIAPGNGCLELWNLLSGWLIFRGHVTMLVSGSVIVDGVKNNQPTEAFSRYPPWN